VRGGSFIGGKRFAGCSDFGLQRLFQSFVWGLVLAFGMGRF